MYTVQQIHRVLLRINKKITKKRFGELDKKSQH